MAQNKRKRTIIIAVAIVAVLLVASVTVALMQSSRNDKQDPYKYGDTTNTSDDEGDKTSEKSDPPTKQPTKDTTDAESTNLDPASVGTLDIAPLDIRVSYVKGAGGFEYQVSKTPSGTEYVEFSSAELVGTKCTDDTGAFASILVNPQSNEASTLDKTTTVSGTKYGLSLASDDCTSDAAKLKEYQKSFSDAFGLLKKLD